jgi:hypothetical protein
MNDPIVITPRKVCGRCEAFLGYEHKGTCFHTGVVRYLQTVEKFTTVENSYAHPPKGEDEVSIRIALVKGRGDQRSIEAEYDATDKLVQFVQRGEEVFGTLEPVEPEEWRQIMHRLHVGSIIDGLAVFADADIQKVAVDALYEAREADKVMDEAATIVAEKVLAAYAPKIREIAMQAGGAASGVFLRKHPDEVMPSEEVAEAVEGVLESFGYADPAAPKPDDSPNSSSENGEG